MLFFFFFLGFEQYHVDMTGMAQTWIFLTQDEMLTREIWSAKQKKKERCNMRTLGPPFY